MRFPYAEVEFESSGALHDPEQRRAALHLLRSSDPTDVLVLAHGWNNDMDAARGLFEQLTDSIAAVQDRVEGADARRLAVIGVLWPSIRWADDDDVAGGGVGLFDEEDALREAIATRMEDASIAAQLTDLVPHLEASSAARERFVELLRHQLPEPAADDEDPPPAALLEDDPQSVFDQVAGPDDDLTPSGAPPDHQAGGLRGGAAVLGPTAMDPRSPAAASDEMQAAADGLQATVGLPAGLHGTAAGFGFGGILRGARSLLNLTTYYTMRARAGDVGARGVAPFVEALAAEAPHVGLHLAGHSFGARVVAAAVSTTSAPVHAVAFLQGAFSHHALAKDYDGRGGDGSFRPILDPSPRVRGPIVVTHTANDRAVGVAYAVASRLARQQAAGVGGPRDLYGGIGRNGARKTPEVAEPAGTLLEVGAPYTFTPGRVHNLRADRFISSHSAVTGREVGYALLAAMTAGANS